MVHLRIGRPFFGNDDINRIGIFVLPSYVCRVTAVSGLHVRQKDWVDEKTWSKTIVWGL
jgi:hypothetical protein